MYPKYFIGCKGGPLLVNFFNGETVELQPGIAVRIPEATYDRVVQELQLPESQRRKLKILERAAPSTFNDRTHLRSQTTCQKYCTTGASYKKASKDNRSKNVS